MQFYRDVGVHAGCIQKYFLQSGQARGYCSYSARRLYKKCAKRRHISRRDHDLSRGMKIHGAVIRGSEKSMYSRANSRIALEELDTEREKTSKTNVQPHVHEDDPRSKITCAQVPDKTLKKYSIARRELTRFDSHRIDLFLFRIRFGSFASPSIRFHGVTSFSASSASLAESS